MCSVKPQNDLSHKGVAIEEWVDLRFFRPIGIRIARALEPTGISADQVTLWCILIGLVAGHLFLYRDPWVNAIGFLVFILSDVLDSADGQLARLRGTSTRFGRSLDGIGDHLRFVNLYVHLAIRLMLAGWHWYGLLLAALAGLSHALQSMAADFIRNAYLTIGEGSTGEVDLPEDHLARRALADRQVGVADEIRRHALKRVRQPRQGGQEQSVPVPAREHEPDGQMDVEVDEPQMVADPVERAPEASGGASQACQLAVGRIEDVRHDEQDEADRVDPGIAIEKQVARDEADEDAPQRDLVGGDPGWLERAGDADPDRPEEPEVDPLLDRDALMRQVVRRLHRAHPSWWPARSSRRLPE